MAVIFEGRNRLKKSLHHETQNKNNSKKAKWITVVFLALALCLTTGLALYYDSAFLYILICLLSILTLGTALSGTAFRSPQRVSIQRGYEGEQRALSLLSSKLNDDYTIFYSIDVEHDGKTSQIDNIIVGPTGIFICEVKNHNSYITGSHLDQYWVQHKAGRYNGYTSTFYNPTKQVGTHIFRTGKYLRSNRISTYIKGAILFTNYNVTLDVKTDKVPVFDINHSDELIGYILSGTEKLDKSQRDEICYVLMKLIDENILEQFASDKITEFKNTK